MDQFVDECLAKRVLRRRAELRDALLGAVTAGTLGLRRGEEHDHDGDVSDQYGGSWPVPD